MDLLSLQSSLADLNLPAVRFFPSLDSTNDEAWRWVRAGAPHQAVVIADEQTAGRGRGQRRWLTPQGAGLAFSLVLHSPPLNPRHFSRLAGLGAMAVRSVLEHKYGIHAQIKWPNDILIDSRKVAGVLVEAHWVGSKLDHVVIGVGINIAPESISDIHLLADGQNIPATSIEGYLGHPVNRLECLHDILDELFHTWLPVLASPEFIEAWEANLAYHGQWVELWDGNTAAPSHPTGEPAPVEVGRLMGLTQDGSLILLTRQGRRVKVADGEIHLRPAINISPRLPAN